MKKWRKEWFKDSDKALEFMNKLNNLLIFEDSIKLVGSSNNFGDVWFVFYCSNIEIKP